MAGSDEAFPIGARVRWTEGGATVQGEVAEIFVESFHREDDGTGTHAEPTEDNPVYRVNRSDGDPVMKSHDELVTA